VPITEIDESDWQANVAEAQGLVLVDFYATWCGSCKAMAPALESIARETNGLYRIFKVDVDKADRLVKLLKITRVPTLIVIRDGLEVARQEGAAPKREILSELKRISGAAQKPGWS
jgi:thioredoxin